MRPAPRPGRWRGVTSGRSRRALRTPEVWAWAVVEPAAAVAAAAAGAGERDPGRGRDRDGGGAAVAAGAPPPSRLILVEAGDWARGARDCHGGLVPLPLAVGGRPGGEGAGRCPGSPRRSRLRPRPSPRLASPSPLSPPPPPPFKHFAGHSSGDV